jgi:hypothetical protein
MTKETAVHGVTLFGSGEVILLLKMFLFYLKKLKFIQQG